MVHRPMDPVDGSPTHLSKSFTQVTLRRYPNEKLTREQALKGMTYDAAYASFSEDRIGSLAPGKKADFVVLNQDILTVAQEKILDTKVVSTVCHMLLSRTDIQLKRAQVIDGQVAYGALRM
jgi:predicted amidohydrolase YtcJ